MDGFETTDTQLDKHTAQQEAGAAGESGKAGNMKWTCGRCRTQFHVGTPPSKNSARGNCSEPGCARRIWWTNPRDGRPVVIGVFSMPVPFEGKAT